MKIEGDEEQSKGSFVFEEVDFSPKILADTKYKVRNVPLQPYSPFSEQVTRAISAGSN